MTTTSRTARARFEAAVASKGWGEDSDRRFGGGERSGRRGLQRPKGSKDGVEDDAARAFKMGKTPWPNFGIPASLPVKGSDSIAEIAADVFMSSIAMVRSNSISVVTVPEL